MDVNQHKVDTFAYVTVSEAFMILSSHSGRFLSLIFWRIVKFNVTWFLYNEPKEQLK